ncbi:hypothetical protein [Oecophyllibacter saccharovorans]|uniref:Uncharacterized protein n=1 Tax=Oecophyllibacter saccharovorans TaxID=2558360 RepID=A0A506UMR8_9PROT|nr:hypothetical protein [Oecophyllibacter saccharovorans]TPW34423.1 hypothetical protein E3202_08020 [Oecophyllibacter saccharovorans]
MKLDKTSSDLNEQSEAYVSCFIIYLHPFRLIETEDDPVKETTYNQVKNQSWNAKDLTKVIGALEVNIEAKVSTQLFVARDGGLALPRLEQLSNTQAVVGKFNLCLAGALLGGIYCQAITPDSLEAGAIKYYASSKQKYMSGEWQAPAAANIFHRQIRFGLASPIEAGALRAPPRVTNFFELKQAIQVGLQILAAVPPVQGEYLLKGVTSFVRLDWGEALANFWIVVEQLISFLWKKYIVDPTLVNDPNSSRRKQLEDRRTWTASTRIEMLTQKDVIPLECFKALATARRARNKLHHEGTHPTKEDAQAAYKGLIELLIVALNGQKLPLLEIVLDEFMLDDPCSVPECEEFKACDPDVLSISQPRY